MKLEFPPFLSLGLASLAADRISEDRISALVTSTIKEILMVECATPCSQSILGRLKELLLAELARRLATAPLPGAEGRPGNCNDPIVARALRFVHADPGRRWTVADLAREAGCSRSVLAERFSAVLGQAPIEYLTRWRMLIAEARIRSSSDSLAAIAADAGYASHAAFHRAFKRVMGVTPGRRRHAEFGPVAPGMRPSSLSHGADAIETATSGEHPIRLLG